MTNHVERQPWQRKDPFNLAGLQDRRIKRDAALTQYKANLRRIQYEERLKQFPLHVQASGPIEFSPTAPAIRESSTTNSSQAAGSQNLTLVYESPQRIHSDPNEKNATFKDNKKPSFIRRISKPLLPLAASVAALFGMTVGSGDIPTNAQAQQEALKPHPDGNTLMLDRAPIDRTPVARNTEAMVSPETTTHYTVKQIAWKQSRVVFTGNIDGSTDEKMVVMDIDFIARERSKGIIIGKPQITILTLAVNGDNIVAAGTELSDPTKGALSYSQQGGTTFKTFSNETNQIQLNPVQRTFIPDGYDPVNGYNPNERNIVIFEESDPNDINNFPKTAKVLDMNTGVINTLSGKVEPRTQVLSSEGQLLPVALNQLKSPVTNSDYVGYFLKTYDLASKTITSTWKYDGTNYGILDNPTQYFRESDRKRITLTFDQNTRPTGTMNYNIEDQFAYSITVNNSDPIYKGGSVPTPFAGAEGKKLYMAMYQQIPYDPVTNEIYRSFLVEIDPANGYDAISKQKVIGSTNNGLPLGDILAVFIVKDGEGGDIPVLIYDKGIWMQKEDGSWGQIPVEKVVPPTATATSTATSTATATRTPSPTPTPTPTPQDKYPYKVRMPVIRDAAQGTPASGGW